jgi:hypothetical protein
MSEIKLESIIKPKDLVAEITKTKGTSNELLLTKSVGKVSEKDCSSSLLEQVIRAGILF